MINLVRLAVGDEVLGHALLTPPIKAGTLAEYAVLPAAAVCAKPTGWAPAVARTAGGRVSADPSGYAEIVNGEPTAGARLR